MKENKNSRSHFIPPRVALIAVVAVACFRCAALAAAPPEYFAIHVIDGQTGRGVPMVELRTTTNVAYCTDSAGYVAFREQGLMDKKVYFEVAAHGYDFPPDAFGAHGIVLDTHAGAEATVKVRRINIAQRLYRMTGAGIYRDSELLGHAHGDVPPLDAQITGQDGTLNAIYNGKLYWFYGDTSRLSHVLGNYSMTGAVSALPEKLNADEWIPRTYFQRSDGFVKPMATMPGEGVVWLFGVVVLPDVQGKQGMFAFFQRRKGLGEVLENGFVRYNDKLEQFEKLNSVPLDPRHFPQGYPFRAKDDDGYIYFTGPLPLLRVKADLSSYLDLASYESFTCLTSDADSADVDRDATTAKPIWKWRRGVSPLSPERQQKLLAAKKLALEDLPVHFVNPENGKQISINNCSVQFNAYRNRYVMIACEQFGASGLGEVWYSEADKPEGPWLRAVKIITHANKPNDPHDFYNPVHRAYLDRDGGRSIYIEGSYVNTFSGNPRATPWYEYNQQMYKLDLSDPRLNLQ